MHDFHKIHGDNLYTLISEVIGYKLKAKFFVHLFKGTSGKNISQMKEL